MTDPGAKYWSDIVSAIEAIERFVEGIDTLNKYTTDHKTRSAVERQLAIIGEAVRHLQRIDPRLALEDAKDIVGMRNRLIHSYDNVDDKLVWQVVRLDLAPLKAVAKSMLPPLNKE